MFEVYRSSLHVWWNHVENSEREIEMIWKLNEVESNMVVVQILSNIVLTINK